MLSSNYEKTVWIDRSVIKCPDGVKKAFIINENKILLIFTGTTKKILRKDVLVLSDFKTSTLFPSLET